MAVAALTSKILFQGGANNVLFTDRREFYPEAEVFEYWKNQTIFLTWLNHLSRETTPDPLYKIFEDANTYVNQYMLATTAIAVDTGGGESNAIGVDNITNITQGETIDDSCVGLVLEVWDSAGVTKRGTMFISDAASTSTIKCKVLKASTITTVDNDVFRVIGTVRGERSVAAESYYNELSVIWNSTQYFSLPIEVTGKLYKETKLKGYSNELGRLRVKKIKEAKYQVQNGLLKSMSTVGTNLGGSGTFTEANLRTITDQDSNSSDVRTTYGFIPCLEDYGVIWEGSGDISSVTNIFKTAAADFDFNTAVDVFEVIFNKRETDVIPGFCGYGFLGSISKAIMGSDFKFAGQFQMGDMKVNTLGFNIRNLTTPFGTVQLTPMKALDNEYKDYCLLPNDQAIGLREYEPWEYITNIKTDNNYNGVKDVINYDVGLQLSLLPTHHIIVLL